MMKNISQGFTLIEMMVVVAIIGILAAVAMPLFQRYAEKAALADAKTAVISVRQTLEAEKLVNPRGFDLNTQAATQVRNKLNASGESFSRKYTFSHSVSDNGLSVFFAAVPKSSNYQYTLWVSDGGNAYKCKNYSARTVPTSKPGNCEAL